MSKRILIIDDEQEILELTRNRLNQKGYEVEVALDAQSGREVLDRLAVDLIILDVLMPNLDGYTFARQLRTDTKTKDIPILIFTAKPGMRDLFDIEGIHAYLLKPFVAEDFLQSVEKLLTGP
ncbi:MAG: response regulator [Candidatus Omnitrophica bacterium]|nr:response regulator [Candidatus Omnitrophota bacterium]